MESHRVGGAGGGGVTSHVTSGEREVANTRLDEETTPACSSPAGAGAGAGHDITTSYLQVVVEKHGAGPGGGGDQHLHPPRLPRASSPLRHKHEASRSEGGVSSRSPVPDRLEVYRFERVGGVLVSRGGPAARVEVRAARGARAACRAGAEVLGAARLAWRLPLAAALGSARAVLEAARDAGAGATAAASDLALKPALATVYGALVHPVLVFAGQVLAGVHEAARPLFAALHDVAGAAARVLAAVRLVEVHVTVACPHRPPPPPSHSAPPDLQHYH